MPGSGVRVSPQLLEGSPKQSNGVSDCYRFALRSTVPMLSIYLTDKLRINIRDYGAIGDGSSHPLSDYYGNLADAQLFYPHATSLSDEMDWAALQAAANAATAAGGGRVHVPHASSGYDIGSKTVTVGGSGVVFEAEDGGTHLRYSGTDYALSFSIAGAHQLHRCASGLYGIGWI